ncbi:MAG: hypothetical protein ABW136_10135 [Steroidobacteraceae bacterium]
MSDQHDPILDHRARLERARRDALEKRDQALIDQRSTTFTAEMRVGIWERLHQVRLPKDPAHPILALVAQNTGLALPEVLEVQRSRAESAPAA